MAEEDDEAVDLDSAGVYYMSVDEFESRADDAASAPQSWRDRLATWVDRLKSVLGGSR